MKEHRKMSEKVEKELFDYYENNSYYAVHILLRYPSNQLTTSYMQPITRFGENENFYQYFRHYRRVGPPGITRGVGFPRIDSAGTRSHSLLHVGHNENMILEE